MSLDYNTTTYSTLLGTVGRPDIREYNLNAKSEKAVSKYGVSKKINREEIQ